jgi:Ca2+-transporting ATPase
VVTVTGDHADTARAVAEEVGIHPDPVITGSGLNGDDRHARLREAGVLARVDPATELDLVRALREHGEVVAMTGGGVNDAPALLNADVGVAMAGDEGTLSCGLHVWPARLACTSGTLVPTARSVRPEACS